MIALTPEAFGGDHFTTAEPLAAVACTELGAVGTPTTKVVAAEAADVPAEFEATTVTL